MAKATKRKRQRQATKIHHHYNVSVDPKTRRPSKKLKNITGSNSGGRSKEKIMAAAESLRHQEPQMASENDITFESCEDIGGDKANEGESDLALRAAKPEELKVEGTEAFYLEPDSELGRGAGSDLGKSERQRPPSMDQNDWRMLLGKDYDEGDNSDGLVENEGVDMEVLSLIRFDVSAGFWDIHPPCHHTKTVLDQEQHTNG